MQIRRSLWMLGVLAAAPWFGGCEHGVELLGDLDATESDLPTPADADVGPPDGDATEFGDGVDGDDDRPADGVCELPGIPVPMLPANGETTGAVATPSGERNPLRPVFHWLVSPGGCDEPDFDIRIDDSCVAGSMASCTFPSPEAYGERVHGSSWQPEADLPIDHSPPVGRRYAWQVRACCGAECCSEWSPPHWLDVGRARNDVNGDGYSDVLVGAPGTDDTFSGWGRAELFLGGPAMDEVADFAVEGTRANDHVGIAVAFVGDFDADGFADFAVGASGASSVPYVVVHFGSPAGVSDGTLRLEPPWDGNLFGQSLDAAGDLDGDGYADMIIGAPGLSGGQGNAFLALGADLGGRGLRGLEQPEEHGFDSMLGWAVAGVGDVNGDGLDDLVVTEPDHDEWIDHDAWFIGVRIAA